MADGVVPDTIRVPFLRGTDMRVLTKVLTVAGAVLAAQSAFAAGGDAATPTYTKDVAPIFQAKCEGCHRADGMGPMKLATYEDARPWVKSIASRVGSRQMPPWHIDKTVGIQKFKNDRSLSDDQIDTILRWVDGGALEGDSKDMPPAKVWPTSNGWKLAEQFGEPELIVRATPYTMEARTEDKWWKPITDVPLTEMRWV